MKRKKVFSGLVAVVVLLSGTTFLYFAGVERAGPIPALAKDPDGPVEGPVNDCTNVGGFCADDLGMSGGCTARDCCPPGDSWCQGWDYRRPNAFQGVGSNPNGICWHYTNYTAPYCTEKYCYDSYYYVCSVYCKPLDDIGSVRLVYAAPPVPIPCVSCQESGADCH